MMEHIHQPPGTEIRCIGGYYTIIEEGRMNYGGGTLLYWIGNVIIDSSCCGTGGGRFIHVAGYIKIWQRHTGPDGLPVSIVEPVADIKDRKNIKRLLEQKFPYSQVSFCEA
jgi:hypothetical protein